MSGCAGQGRGARVVEGSWPASFGAARNAAVRHCRGRWVLMVDADEEARCPDPQAVRRVLADAPGAAVAFWVPIDNRTGLGLGSGYAHAASRLYRRGRCEWRGRIHEQLVDLATGQLAPTLRVPGLRLAHDGYLATVEVARGKIERNVALARAEVEDPSLGDRGVALVWLGRALWAAGELEEALAALRDGSAEAGVPSARRLGLQGACEVALLLGQLDEAERLAQALRRASVRPAVPDWLEARVALVAGDPARAVALLDPYLESGAEGDDGRQVGPKEALEPWVEAMLALGRADEAAARLLTRLEQGLGLEVRLEVVVRAVRGAGRPLRELAAVLPLAEPEALVAGALHGLEPKDASKLLEALLDRVHHEAAASQQPLVVRTEGALLAGAAWLVARLDPATAEGWRRVLLDRGLAGLLA
ncbi:glycosyltransferase [Aciditerrimonas ferrireducens]|uniref:glycosyltransferase n=1 Tax=Aciditerrimonas ferrireducens TaxID=667306 RepID=UPI0035E3BD45